MKVVNITEVMIKLQFKLPQALISRGFTRRTVVNNLFKSNVYVISHKIIVKSLLCLLYSRTKEKD